MEKMYKKYRNDVEFRLVYINEAHAADSDWAVDYAKEKNITEHDDFGERCTTAEMLVKDQSLTIPFVIDNMDNKVNTAYKAWPDRVFLVRTDGRLAVAAARGPWGFGPAIEETKKWLAEFKAQDAEPALPDDAAPAGKEVNAQAKDDDAKGNEDSASSSAANHPAAAVLGAWAMSISFGQNTTDATMTIALKDGKLVGTWDSERGGGNLDNITFSDGTLSFERNIGGGERSFTIGYTGKVDGDTITGAFASDQMGEIECNGKRVKKK